MRFRSSTRALLTVAFFAVLPARAHAECAAVVKALARLATDV